MANVDCRRESLFEVIGSGDQVQNKTPAPDVYARVLREMGLPAEACLTIEDTPIGLNMARAAGLSSEQLKNWHALGQAHWDRLHYNQLRKHEYAACRHRHNGDRHGPIKPLRRPRPERG